MTISEIYEASYVEHCIDNCDDTKYEWAASEVFDLTTYDGELDDLLVKKIIEVLKVILTRTNFEYIGDKTNYINYILVCQLLDKFHWIDWGTSIRGAWFCPHLTPHLILEEQREISYVDGVWKECVSRQAVDCTEENLKALIEFIEKEEQK